MTSQTLGLIVATVCLVSEAKSTFSNYVTPCGFVKGFLHKLPYISSTDISVDHMQSSLIQELFICLKAQTYMPVKSGFPISLEQC